MRNPHRTQPVVVSEQQKIKTQKSKTEEIDALLAPGEVVLWRGKPERRPFVFRTWPLSIFGLALIVAALFYEVIVLTTEAPDLLRRGVEASNLYMPLSRWFGEYEDGGRVEFVVAWRVWERIVNLPLWPVREEMVEDVVWAFGEGE